MPQSLTPRQLGPSGPAVSPMGLGTWAIGGPFYSGPGCAYPTGAALGWGEVDDTQSIRAIHCALDHGITLFDTADAYGTGRAERVLGQALRDKRADVLIASKFGNSYDEATRTLIGQDVSPAYIRRACEASLRRLGSDCIDLYQLHCGDLPLTDAPAVAETLETLRQEGLIRAYGWSTDDPERASASASWSGTVAVQHDLNVFQDAPDMLDLCHKHDLASINRAPLAMGFLSGKITATSRLASDDIRNQPPAWLPYFQAGGGASAAWLAKLDSLREILTSNGRTLVQGALAWIWARDPRTIPIPGARTPEQVAENAGAMAFGPLSRDQMTEIDRLLDR